MRANFKILKKKNLLHKVPRNLLRTLCGVWWGGHPQTMLKLYRTLIWPQIDYCSIIYHHAAKSHTKKIDIQNKALRIYPLEYGSVLRHCKFLIPLTKEHRMPHDFPLFYSMYPVQVFVELHMAFWNVNSLKRGKIFY